MHCNHEKLLSEQLNYPCPLVLRIDELSIHRGRTKGANLKAEQKHLLERKFEKEPSIRIAYEFKEELCSILCMREQKRISCIPLLAKLKEMVWQMLHDTPEIFKKLGRTLQQWFEPIIRMRRFSWSHGITEVFHRNMKLIQRRPMAIVTLKTTDYDC